MIFRTRHATRAFGFESETTRTMYLQELLSKRFFIECSDRTSYILVKSMRVNAEISARPA